ncbi:hypothetical protein M408DRAFT_332727 [Serendipita vermifera MAFF 305830]|uniref:Uncharacterized protein n=1 Tax=Serendipita vermifera MAFF 305830 TaxID=933852 RepID=A0A0C2W8U3_SERVB|nr:hypothetical protein M408DRAFT_332727 [Serendipita vermifera MAFF 305830]
MERLSALEDVREWCAANLRKRLGSAAAIKSISRLEPEAGSSRLGTSPSDGRLNSSSSDSLVSA